MPHADGHDDGMLTSQNLGTTTADSLPDDITSHIVAALPQEALRSLSETSHAWRSLSQRSVVSLQPRCMPTEEMFARYPNLTSLSLKRYQLLQAAELSTLRGFSGLAELCLHGHAKLEDDVLGRITIALPALTSLNLSGCRKMTWPGLGQLQTLTNLQKLNCTGIKYVSGSPMTVLVEVLQRLRTLIIGDGATLSYVDDELLRLISNNASCLTSLDCSGCIDVTDAGIESLTRLTPSLTHLSLQSCVRVTQTGIAAAVATLKSLTSLNLRGCMQLYDEGLSSLSVLTNLTSLSVQSCTGLKGPGFHALGNCTRLVNLNVRDCHFLSTLDGVANVKSLTHLSVARCTSIRPAHLAVLSSLTALQYLDANHLSMTARAVTTAPANLQLDNLKALTNLKELDVSHMRHVHGIPAGLLHAISHMTALERLNMANMCAPAAPVAQTGTSSPATGSDGDMQEDLTTPDNTTQGRCAAQLAFLAPLKQLQVLNLSGWHHTSPCALIHVSGLTQLTHLVLDRLGNSLVEACSDKQGTQQYTASRDDVQHEEGTLMSQSSQAVQPPQPPRASCTCGVRRMPHSQSVATAPLVSTGSCSSLNMTCLEHHLAACGLYNDNSVTSGEELAGSYSPGCSQPTLGASQSDVQQPDSSSAGSLGVMDAALQHLAPLRQLKHLDLQACMGITDTGVSTLHSLSSLHTLNLGGCKHVRGSGLQHMAAGCKQLSKLVLENCSALCEPALLPALPHLNRLSCLNLAGCRALGDDTCKALAAAGMCRLGQLSLRACDKITSRGATYLAHHFPSLASLDLSNCWAVEDAGMLALAYHACRLTHLDLSYCWRLSVSAVAEACQVNPLLGLQVTHTCLSKGQANPVDSSAMDSSDEQLDSWTEAGSEESAVEGPVVDLTRRQPMVEEGTGEDMSTLGCALEDAELLMRDTWSAMYGDSSLQNV